MFNYATDCGCHCAGPGVTSNLCWPRSIQVLPDFAGLSCREGIGVPLFAGSEQIKLTGLKRKSITLHGAAAATDSEICQHVLRYDSYAATC